MTLVIRCRARRRPRGAGPPPLVFLCEVLISGHGYFSALALLAVPFGSLERGLPWYDVGGPGARGGVDLSIGASRNVSLGVGRISGHPRRGARM
jgi:hypothetical protein